MGKVSLLSWKCALKGALPINVSGVKNGIRMTFWSTQSRMTCWLGASCPSLERSMRRTRPSKRNPSPTLRKWFSWVTSSLLKVLDSIPVFSQRFRLAVLRTVTVGVLPRFNWTISAHMIAQFSDLMSPCIVSERTRSSSGISMLKPPSTASWGFLVSHRCCDPSLQKVTLTTRVSEPAIHVGEVLTTDGRPIMNMSRALTPAEGRYRKIESLRVSSGVALVWASCYYWVIISLWSQAIALWSLSKVASSRITRWAILLCVQLFDFDIRYKVDELISHADALTRLKLYYLDECHAEDFVITGAYEENAAVDIMCQRRGNGISGRENGNTRTR